jgi:hypothetical protein
MIEVTLVSGKRIVIPRASIVYVEEAGASSQWHGIKSYIHLITGKVIECQETYSKIAAL